MTRINDSTQNYLCGNETDRLTPGSYCAMYLRGRAKRYASDYARRIVANCEALYHEGRVARIESAGKRTAYCYVQFVTKV